MTLEDIEKSLAENKKSEEGKEARHERDSSRRHRHHRHHREEDEGHQHRHKRRKRSEDEEERNHTHQTHHGGQPSRIRSSRHAEDTIGDTATPSPVNNTKQPQTSDLDGQMKRDTWMEEPSALDFDYTQKGARKPSAPTTSSASKADFELKIHENDMNKHHLQHLADGQLFSGELVNEPAQHAANYTFGDVGAHWRMTRLKAVYRRATEEERAVEDVAMEHYGDLRTFDDAREEQIELDRRETYGKDYVGKEKPSGELFETRLEMGVKNRSSPSQDSSEDTGNASKSVKIAQPAAKTVPLSQTELNRLKAQMLKAKVRRATNAASLEAEYETAMAVFANQTEPDTIVLGAMENRMLAGSRNGEVKAIDNKRGRDRGLVEENEDMSIEDMVREERRTPNQAGGDGRRFAERIAKDGKFDASALLFVYRYVLTNLQNDLEYMEENATKLAKRVQKSEVNLKNTAISDFQKMNRILDHCPLCHHEDTNTPPLAPVVSLATRVYLTLPTEPEISDGGACIVPIQHRNNLLECDEDEWEEVRVGIACTCTLSKFANRPLEFHEESHTYVP